MAVCGSFFACKHNMLLLSRNGFNIDVSVITHKQHKLKIRESYNDLRLQKYTKIIKVQHLKTRNLCSMRHFHGLSWLLHN